MKRNYIIGSHINKELKFDILAGDSKKTLITSCEFTVDGPFKTIMFYQIVKEKIQLVDFVKFNYNETGLNTFQLPLLRD